MQHSFSIKAALTFGWVQFKKNFWFLVFFTLASLVAQVVFGAEKGSPIWIAVTQIIAMVVSTFSMMTFTRIGLKALKGEGFTWGQAFDINWNVFGVFILASVISSVVSAIGFVLLIIPGIIVAVRLSFFGFAIIEENLHAIDALKRSWALTKGHFWEVFLLGLVLCVMNALGVIAFGVGILVTIPVTLVATAYVYDRLKSIPSVVAPVTPSQAS